MLTNAGMLYARCAGAGACDAVVQLRWLSGPSVCIIQWCGTQQDRNVVVFCAVAYYLLKSTFLVLFRYSLIGVFLWFSILGGVIERSCLVYRYPLEIIFLSSKLKEIYVTIS